MKQKPCPVGFIFRNIIINNPVSYEIDITALAYIRGNRSTGIHLSKVPQWQEPTSCTGIDKMPELS